MISTRPLDVRTVMPMMWGHHMNFHVGTGLVSTLATVSPVGQHLMDISQGLDWFSPPVVFYFDVFGFTTCPVEGAQSLKPWLCSFTIVGTERRRAVLRAALSILI